MTTNIEATTAGTPTVKIGNVKKQFQGLFRVTCVEVTLTEASIAAQVASQVDVTVPGVEFGDFVFVSYPADLTGLIAHAFVQAADKVTITHFNVEGTDAVTALSGGLVAKLLILKPDFNI